MNTTLNEFRSPDKRIDIIREVMPKAKARGMDFIAWDYNNAFPNMPREMPRAGYALDSGSRRLWSHVGRAPSPAAGPLAGLQQADGGVRRGPGGPPHQAHARAIT